MDLLRKYEIAGFAVREFDEVDSTNNYLKRRVDVGTDKEAVIARSQTAGRGRRGRSFFSPVSGLYMSLLVRAKMHPSEVKFVTPMTAVAVARALEDCGSPQTGIKWVNDIYIGGRKVCGILTEPIFGASADGSAPTVTLVVGIGVNICEPEGGFPKDIITRAGAAFSVTSPVEAESKRRELADAIIARFAEGQARIADREFLEDYRRKSVLGGRMVEVLTASGSYIATVEGIDDECRLVVRTPEGICRLDTGEVSVKVE